jgi:hypothetical protein
MEHLAIDLGGRESQICVRSSEDRSWRSGGVGPWRCPCDPQEFGVADLGSEIRLGASFRSGSWLQTVLVMEPS